MRLARTLAIVPLALLSVGLVVVLGAASWGCYPKNCDPKTDPLKCQCPDGPCGEYPKAAADAGAEGGVR